MGRPGSQKAILFYMCMIQKYASTVFGAKCAYNITHVSFYMVRQVLADGYSHGNRMQIRFTKFT